MVLEESMLIILEKIIQKKEELHLVDCLEFLKTLLCISITLQNRLKPPLYLNLILRVKQVKLVY